MTTTPADDSTQDTRLRDRAMKRLKKRRDFRGHLLVYALVNAFLVVIWAMTTRTASSGRCSRWSGGASVW